MSRNPAKDFGPIAADYKFFEDHATEGEQDARAYLQQIVQFGPANGIVRFLDFGCGSGNFTSRLLTQAQWPPQRLRLTLVEPVVSARQQAASRLADFVESPVTQFEELAAGLTASFEIIIANHVFYYVPNLKDHLLRLIDALAPAGIFLTAIAAKTNALIEFWTTGFELLGREIPYNTAEDVEVALQELGAAYQKKQIAFVLTFPDTEENRMRIIRFLLGEYLPKIPLRPLLDLFDQHCRAGKIEIRTSSDHFTIRRGTPCIAGR